MVKEKELKEMHNRGRKIQKDAHKDREHFEGILVGLFLSLLTNYIITVGTPLVTQYHPCIQIVLFSFVILFLLFFIWKYWNLIKLAIHQENIGIKMQSNALEELQSKEDLKKKTDSKKK